MAGPDIRMLGPQETLESHYDRARVFVAPVHFAGGVPAKIIESVCNGLPTVASALLVQQLDWRDGLDILGAQDAPAFAIPLPFCLKTTPPGSGSNWRVGSNAHSAMTRTCLSAPCTVCWYHRWRAMAQTK